MPGPVGAVGDWVARNAGIVVGLGIGTAAKYGLTLTEGRRVTWRTLFIDMLLLGMLGVIAIIIADFWNLTGNPRVLVGALSAVSSDRLIRLVQDRFMKKVETDLTVSARAAAGTAVRVPAGVGEPDDMVVQPAVEDDRQNRAGAALKSAYRAPTRQSLPRDQAELVRRLRDTPDI